MGKKKKKNNGYYGCSVIKSKDKKSKKKDKKSKDINLMSNKASIDRKDVKTARKIVLSPVKVPDSFTDVRRACNHALKLITPAEYKSMTPSYAAYTPMLDWAISMYGEDNVAVCSGCYDVVVKYDKVNSEDVMKAITTLHLAANKVLSMKRLKNDEIKDLTKLRDNMDKWVEVAEEITHLDDVSSAYAEKAHDGQSLNSVGNNYVM